MTGKCNKNPVLSALKWTILIFILFFPKGCYARSLVVVHEKAGFLGEEIKQALKIKSLSAAKITRLVIQGKAPMTYADCRDLVAYEHRAGRKKSDVTIKDILPNLGILDLSGVRFEHNAMLSPFVSQFEYSMGESLLGSFENFVTLKQIFLPESLIVIGARTFAGCRNLEKISFPKNLQSIGADAFYGCVNFDFPDLLVLEIEHRKSDFLAEEIRLMLEKSGQPADLVTEVRIFGEAPMSHEDCRTLVSFTPGEHDLSPPIRGILPYLKKMDLRNAVFENNTVQGRLLSARDKEYKKWIENLGEDVVGISPPPPRGAFEGFTGLEEVLLPESLEEISSYAFCQCHKLKTILWPSNLKSIGDYAFAYCESLAPLQLPHDIKMGRNVFYR